MKLTDRQANEILDQVRGKRGKRFDVLRAYAMNALRANAAKRLATLALGITIISNGHAMTLPDIGTPQYSASCQITRNWDDDVRARCREDGAVYRYDFDGQPSMEYAPHRFPKRSAGWVPVN